jgi:hypothetical protein
MAMIVFGPFIIASHDYFPLTMASSAPLKAASMASKKPVAKISKKDIVLVLMEQEGPI